MKYFEPNKIFFTISKVQKYVLFLFIVVLSIGLTEALILSPEDYKQSDPYLFLDNHYIRLLPTKPQGGLLRGRSPSLDIT